MLMRRRSKSIQELLLLLATIAVCRCVTTLAFVTQRSVIASATRTSRSPAALFAASSSAKDGSSQSSKQNWLGTVADAATGATFTLLHAFDDDPIQDSSKNLRVLWTRALLNKRGLIDDPVAMQFLPPTTRDLALNVASSSLFDPVVEKLEFIEARTKFIDDSLQDFLEQHPGECNVVLFGAGYDTRAIRFRQNENANFIEVDLPVVCEGKAKLYEAYDRETADSLTNNKSTLVPFDLNACGGDSPVSLMSVLREQGGFKDGIPTFFVWEAVLFYVNKDAVGNIMKEVFDYCKAVKANSGTVCFTDSLRPFVKGPATPEAKAFFARNNLDLVDHKPRWGGTVHFALAKSVQ